MKLRSKKILLRGFFEWHCYTRLCRRKNFLDKSMGEKISSNCSTMCNKTFSYCCRLFFVYQTAPNSLPSIRWNWLQKLDCIRFLTCCNKYLAPITCSCCTKRFTLTVNANLIKIAKQQNQYIHVVANENRIVE